MAANAFDINHDCAHCTRHETFHTGETNIIRSSQKISGCVEMLGGKVVYLFQDPSLVKKRYGIRVATLLCGAGEEE